MCAEDATPNSRSHTPVLYVQAQPLALSPSAQVLDSAAAASGRASQQTIVAPSERGTSQSSLSLSGSRSVGHFQTKAQPNAYVKRDSTSAGSGSASTVEPSDRRRSTASHGHTIQYATIALPESSPVSSSIPIPSYQPAAVAAASTDVVVSVAPESRVPLASSADVTRRESVGDESGYMPPDFALLTDKQMKQQLTASGNGSQTLTSREPSHNSHTESTPLMKENSDPPQKCLANNRALGANDRSDGPRAATLARAAPERVPLLEADQFPSRSNSDSHSRSGTSTFSNSSRLTNSGNSQSVFNGENASELANTHRSSQHALLIGARGSSAAGGLISSHSHSHSPTGLGAVALKEDTQREYLEMEPMQLTSNQSQSRGAAPNRQQIERQRSATSLFSGQVAPVSKSAAVAGDQQPSLKPQNTWGPWHQSNPPNNLSQ